MALTINPTVSGTHRRFVFHSFGFLASAFVGASLSGLLVVLAFGALGTVVPSAALVVLALAAIGWAVLHDLGVPIWLPYRPGQVPEWFRSAFSPGAVAVLFGFQLGAGFFTFFTYSTHVAMLMALPFLGSLAHVLLVTFLFAVGKSLVLIMGVGTSSVGDITPRFAASVQKLRTLRLTTATMSFLLALVVARSGFPT